LAPVQQTLVLLKPDAAQRGLVGEIISRFERTGLKIVAMKLMRVDDALAHKHYGVHEGKPFFPGLVKFITASPIVAMVLEGLGAVDKVRSVMGPTDPLKAPPGTIRGDLGVDIGRNMVHGSDSAESAAKEVALFFNAKELVAYQRDYERWIVE
jgi:nucleoside-diphosphate kinase